MMFVPTATNSISFEQMSTLPSPAPGVTSSSAEAHGPPASVSLGSFAHYAGRMYAQHLDNTIGAYGRELYTRGTGIADGLSELGVRIYNDPSGTATDIGTGLVSMFVDDVVGTISAYPDVYGALSAGDFSGASERYWQGVKSAHRTAGSVVGFSGTLGSIRRGVFAAAKGGGGVSARFVTNPAGVSLDLHTFRGLTRNPGMITVGRSGAGSALTGPANSYSVTSGSHRLVYGPEGRLMYDVSRGRIKAFQWNQAPNGKWFPRTGSDLKFPEVPQVVLDTLGF